MADLSPQSPVRRPYTRPEFEAQRRLWARQERNWGVALAVAAVGLGFGQLGFIRWADRHGGKPRWVAVEGALFLGYLLVVGTLAVVMRRRAGAARPRCPACGTVLAGMSERVAAATGRCDRCGGEVVGAGPVSLSNEGSS